MTVSVEEYLRTSYRPDCDYVDGKVLERNVGERAHSTAMREVLFSLVDRYPALRDRILLSQRIRVCDTRIRVPDVCVLSDNAPDEEITITPPALCVEILSPKDLFTDIMDRVKDYFAMGVPICWIIDPISREGWVATPGKSIEATDGILRASGIEMPLAEVLE